jgi:hypothetical protein
MFYSPFISPHSVSCTSPFIACRRYEIYFAEPGTDVYYFGASYAHQWQGEQGQLRLEGGFAGSTADLAAWAMTL